jgi:hypothetical protein
VFQYSSLLRKAAATFPKFPTQFDRISPDHQAIPAVSGPRPSPVLYQYVISDVIDGPALDWPLAELGKVRVTEAKMATTTESRVFRFIPSPQ